MHRIRPLLVVALLLAAAACSDDEATTTTTAASDGATTTSATGEPTTSTTEAAGCTTDIAVVNAAAAELDGLEDRTLDAVTVWADEGPHESNTVDYDHSLSLAISEVEIPEDPQFGLGIPIGAPDDLGDDQLYVSFSFYNADDTVGAGQTYIDQLSFEEGVQDGELNSVLAFYGGERLLLGDTTITITELTDDQVCGEISTVTDTDLQTFIGFEGTFAADRIQALEG